ncbi:MAG: hypothetical protein ACLPN1_02405, partial [Dissulfurispiraceae bacterium]
LSIKMGQLGNYAPLHHEEICSGWSIFGYQNPALLVNFRLSKPGETQDAGMHSYGKGAGRVHVSYESRYYGKQQYSSG